MSTDLPDRAAAQALLDADAISKALSRIAHELIERSDELERVALPDHRALDLVEHLAGELVDAAELH